MKTLKEKILNIPESDHRWIFRKYKKLFKDLCEYTNFLPLDSPCLRRVYHVLNDITEIPKCNTCNVKNKRWRGRDGKFYTQFCSPKCLRNNSATKINYKNAILKKYGCESPFQAEEVKKKRTETLLERYGVEHPNDNPVIREKMLTSTLSTLSKEGIVNISQRPIVKEKVQKTHDEKYGGMGLGSGYISSKIYKTMLEKYGVKYPMHHPSIKQLAIDTCMEKYGVKYPMQDLEIFEKAMLSQYSTKDYTLPSGKVVKVQGYEPLVLDDLFAAGYEESDILTDSSDIEKYTGSVMYIGEDGKEHRYYPDIYIISENKVIEVKSSYTMEADYNKNLLKEQAVLDLNIDFEFVIK